MEEEESDFAKERELILGGGEVVGGSWRVAFIHFCTFLAFYSL